jgi:hypothetical protein
MSIYITGEKKLKHPQCKLMELRREALESRLNSWCKLVLIKWLFWYDCNGVYSDGESLHEFGNMVSKVEAIDFISRQIIEA